ncbi:hypothetical protein [Leptolyngbya sp. O-77]|nr:hypothetical protein [Leptolyngbya sp. O-77]
MIRSWMVIGGVMLGLAFALGQRDHFAGARLVSAAAAARLAHV